VIFAVLEFADAFFIVGLAIARTFFGPVDLDDVSDEIVRFPKQKQLYLNYSCFQFQAW
jgi:hypothetical protein